MPEAMIPSQRHRTETSPFRKSNIMPTKKAHRREASSSKVVKKFLQSYLVKSIKTHLNVCTVRLHCSSTSLVKQTACEATGKASQLDPSYSNATPPKNARVPAASILLPRNTVEQKFLPANDLAFGNLRRPAVSIAL